MSQANSILDLKHIVFIGRTFDEYMKMFNLSEEDIQNFKILDCPAGACSFNAVASKKGRDIISSDIAYFHEADTLYSKGLEDIKHTMDSMERAKDGYIWSHYKSVDELRQNRIVAFKDFIQHMKQYPEKYIPATLPNLPFQDEEFDLILSAHFLFMYSDRLSYKFHKNTILEFMRVVKKEIRIFPLTDLSGNTSSYVEPIIDFVKEKGWKAEIIKVPYEFQRNANTMLKITK